MRILLVANLNHPEQLAAAVAATPAGQEPPLFPPGTNQDSWVRALRRRGHETAVFWRNRPARNFRYSERITPGAVARALWRRVPPAARPDIQRRNRQLLAAAGAFRPDILWLEGGNQVITAQTLARIKNALQCRVILSSGDSPFAMRHLPEHQAAPLYDLALVNDHYHGREWLELGARKAVSLPLSATDPDWHYPRRLEAEERAALACDIAFVGTLVPESHYGSRVRALLALRDFDLGIWSVFPVPAELRPFLRGAALGESAMRALSAAKLTVNHHGPTFRWGGNIRLFEAAGVGTLQLADDLPGTRSWFTPGENIVLFRDGEELRRKAAYYLAHDEEREALARKAREHVLAQHNFDRRVAALEDLLATL